LIKKYLQLFVDVEHLKTNLIAMGHMQKYVSKQVRQYKKEKFRNRKVVEFLKMVVVVENPKFTEAYPNKWNNK
jgi:2-methylcitrate dehydratase PrpD